MDRMTGEKESGEEPDVPARQSPRQFRDQGGHAGVEEDVDQMKGPSQIPMQPHLDAKALGDQRPVEIVQSTVEPIVCPELSPESWALHSWIAVDEDGVIVNIGATERDRIKGRGEESAERRRRPGSGGDFHGAMVAKTPGDQKSGKIVGRAS